jgi:hypothetical protein
MAGDALHAPGEMVCLPDGRGFFAVGTITGSGDLTMEEVVASGAMELDSGVSVFTEQRKGLVTPMAYNHFVYAESRVGWLHIDPGGSSLSFGFTHTHRDTMFLFVVPIFVSVKFQLID